MAGGWRAENDQGGGLCAQWFADWEPVAGSKGEGGRRRGLVCTPALSSCSTLRGRQLGALTPRSKPSCAPLSLGGRSMALGPSGMQRPGLIRLLHGIFSWGRSELKHAQFQKPGSYLQGRAWCRRISRASTLRFWDWLRGRTACNYPIADPFDPSAEYTSVEALSGVRNAQPLWGQDRAMSLGAEAKTGETVCTRSRERAPEKKRTKKKYSARVPDMGEIIDSLPIRKRSVCRFPMQPW